jgi:hypothetical protein
MAIGNPSSRRQAGFITPLHHTLSAASTSLRPQILRALSRIEFLSFPWDWLPACPFFHDPGSEMLRGTVQFLLKTDRLEAILYPTSHLIKGSVRFDDRFETAHPSPNRS